MKTGTISATKQYLDLFLRQYVETTQIVSNDDLSMKLFSHDMEEKISGHQ